MASEVKVLVKAENQTKTGFQSALNDAKKFGQEATKAATPGGGSGGAEVRKALKGLGSDLAQASTPAEALQAVVTRVAGAFGKVTAVVGAFAVGKIIAGQFEKLSEGVANSTSRLNEFTESAQNVATATNLESALSGFDAMQSSISAARSELQNLSSDFGALAANVLTGGAAFRVMQENIEAMQRVAAASLVSSTALQAKQAEQTAAAMQSGGKSAVGELATKQARDREIAALQARLDQAINQKDGNTEASVRAAIENKRKQFNSEDAIRALSAQQEAAAAADKTASLGMTPTQLLQNEKKAIAELKQQQKQFVSSAALNGISGGALSDGTRQYYEIQTQIEGRQQRLIILQKQIDAETKKSAPAIGPEFGPGTAEAATGGFRVDAADFARQQQERLLRQSQSAQSQMTGSFGASQLQRIGFASSEFFDTRRKEDPAKSMQQIVKELQKVNKNLEGGQPLVLTGGT